MALGLPDIQYQEVDDDVGEGTYANEYGSNDGKLLEGKRRHSELKLAITGSLQRAQK